MKTFNATLLLILLLCCNVSAQTRRIGITYEPTIAYTPSPSLMLNTDPPIFHYFSQRFGHTVGIDYIISVKNNGFKTGIYFLDSGYKKEIAQEDLTLRKDAYYLQYFSVPVEYYGSFKNIYVNVGPNANVLLREFIKNEAGGSIIDFKKSESMFMLGLRGEIGVNIPLTNELTANLGGFYRMLFLSLIHI